MTQESIWPPKGSSEQRPAERRPCKICGNQIAIVQDRNNPERVRILDLDVAGYILVTHSHGNEEAVRSRNFHIDHAAICGTTQKGAKNG